MGPRWELLIKNQNFPVGIRIGIGIGMEKGRHFKFESKIRRKFPIGIGIGIGMERGRLFIFESKIGILIGRKFPIPIPIPILR